jgi:hypothetical protein
VALLNANKKFRDVQAALSGYLTYRSKNAEPWMYTALALSIRMNKGSEADVKKALGYAADVAIRGRNPNDLVSVADQMLVMDCPDRAGALLDQASDLVPHRNEPLMISINLAQRTRDPKRMAVSVDKLLSFGWPGPPGFDENIRSEARKQAEMLAKRLREENHADEADALLAGLPESEARDVFVRLTWLGDADFDLAVDEPLGATARFNTPRTVFGGSIIQNGYGAHPTEVYVCPRGFDGEYTIHVEMIYNNPEKPALQATLEIITHEGTAKEHKETRTITVGAKAAESFKVTLSGGRRKKALPYLAPIQIPVPQPKGQKRKDQAAPDAKPGDARPKPDAGAIR